MIIDEKGSADYNVYMMLGALFAEDAYYTQAIAYFDKALKIRSGDAAALFEKAYMNLVFIQNRDTGVLLLEEALKAGFKDKAKIEKLLSIQELKTDTVIVDLIKKYPAD